MKKSLLVMQFYDRSYKNKGIEELLKAPISAIKGVSESDAADLKEAFGIEAVEDLATNKYVRIAQGINCLSRSSAEVLGKTFDSREYHTLREKPVSAISGISDEDASVLKKALGIGTIKELAENKYVLIAQMTVTIASMMKSSQSYQRSVFKSAIACISLFSASLILGHFRNYFVIIPIVVLLVLYFFIQYRLNRYVSLRILRSYVKSVFEDAKSALEILTALTLCFLFYIVISIFIPISAKSPQEWIYSNRYGIYVSIMLIGVLWIVFSSVMDHKILRYKNGTLRLARSLHRKIRFLEYWSENLFILVYGLVLIPGVSLMKRLPLEIAATMLFVTLVAICWHYRRRLILRKLANILLLGLIFSHSFYLAVGAFEVQTEDFEIMLSETIKGIEGFAQYTNYVNCLFQELSDQYLVLDYRRVDGKPVEFYLDDIYSCFETAQESHEEASRYYFSAKKHFSKAREIGESLVAKSVGLTNEFVVKINRLVNVLDNRLYTMEKFNELCLIWNRCSFETDYLGANFSRDASEILNELEKQDTALAELGFPLSFFSETPWIRSIKIRTEFMMKEMILASNWNITYYRLYANENETVGRATLRLTNPTEHTFLFYFIEIDGLPETKYEIVDLMPDRFIRINDTTFLQNIGIDPSFINPNDPFTWLPVELIIEPQQTIELEFTIKCNLTHTSPYEALVYVHFAEWTSSLETGVSVDTFENWFTFRLPAEIVAKCHEQ